MVMCCYTVFSMGWRCPSSMKLVGRAQSDEQFSLPVPRLCLGSMTETNTKDLGSAPSVCYAGLLQCSWSAKVDRMAF